MAIENAFDRAGPKPSDEASRERKKNYAEAVSNNLARELAEELRAIGFSEVIPMRDGPTEYTFYGGLGSKRVDVSLSDEAHGLLLANVAEGHPVSRQSKPGVSQESGQQAGRLVR